MANKSTESRINSIQEEVKQKESDLNALRYRASSSSQGGVSGGAVIYSFTDESVYDPASGRTQEDETAAYEGLSFLSIFLISSAVTALYGALVMAVVPLLCKRKEGENNGRDN